MEEKQAVLFSGQLLSIESMNWHAAAAKEGNFALKSFFNHKGSYIEEGVFVS